MMFVFLKEFERAPTTPTWIGPFAKPKTHRPQSSAIINRISKSSQKPPKEFTIIYHGHHGQERCAILCSEHKMFSD